MIRKAISRIWKWLGRDRAATNKRLLFDLEDNPVDEEDVELIINIAKDFSQAPRGAGPDVGEFNGQAFRQKHLVPRLKEAAANGSRVAIVLDGLAYPPSAEFLKSVFGPLAKDTGMTPKDIVSLLVMSERTDIDWITRGLALRFVTEPDDP